MSTKCEGFKCHRPATAELRTYRAPGRFGSVKTLCRDCYEALAWSNDPPPPGQEFERLPLVQAEAKQIHDAATAAVFDLAAEIKSQAIAMNRVMAAQIAQLVPVAPEAAPKHPETQEEVEYLRDSHIAMRAALIAAYNFVQAVEAMPINSIEGADARKLLHTIDAALKGNR